MSLHCVYERDTATDEGALRAQVEKGDQVLLLGSAVVLASDRLDWTEALLAKGVAVAALNEDLNAYGIDDLAPSVERADYARWLEMAIEQPNQRLWR